MSPSPSIKKCPKCDMDMQNDRKLASFIEVSLVKEDQFTGDPILTYYCEGCGYVELYKKKK